MQNMNHVDQMMHQAVTEEVFPCGVLLVSKGDRIRFQGAYGTVNAASGEPATMETVFDLASLTKPLATTLVVVHLVQEGFLRPDDPVGRFLPGLKTSDKADIQIEHLLRHTSGLPDYRPYFESLRDIPERERKQRLWDLLATETLESGIGTETRYSDPGFLMLQQVVETIAGARLDQLAEKIIFRPMGLTHLFFSPEQKNLANIRFAATEDCPWRGRILKGEVHDENAWVIGGVAGHAGCFGDIVSVHLLLKEILHTWHDKSSHVLFSSDLVRSFLSTGKSGDRPMGFDCPAVKEPSCGRYFSSRTVGHLGFTGTSFWMDLDQEVIVILLTNRIHPTRENLKIRKFRPRIHDAVMEAI